MKVVKEKEIIHDNEENDYASKGVGNAGLTLGIIGTGLGLWALSRNRVSLFGGGAGMPENVNINTVSDAIAGRSGGAPTAFQAWEKGCDDAIALTNAMWRMKLNTQEQMYAHRETDVNEKFQLWQSQVKADFDLYRVSRDLYDVLNERYGNKFNELDKKVAVLEATRPYQDRLIQCEIDKAFTAAINYADRLDCRNIKGIVGLPSTPTVTVLEGATCCRSRQPQAE